MGRRVLMDVLEQTGDGVWLFVAIVPAEYVKKLLDDFIFNINPLLGYDFFNELALHLCIAITTTLNFKVLGDIDDLISVQ
jgi:hypothetical protein